MFDIRLPRTALILLAGAALSGSGAAYQGLFRNPLADPYIIGVASGAGLGAVIAMGLKRIASFLDKIANPLSRAISNFGAGVLVLMMFLTAMDVLLRYFLHSPISGSLELTQYMMLIVVVSGLALEADVRRRLSGLSRSRF